MPLLPNPSVGDRGKLRYSRPGGRAAVLLYVLPGKGPVLAQELRIFLIPYFGVSLRVSGVPGQPAGVQAPPTSGEAVGEQAAAGVAAGRAVGLQDAVIQEVARPLRREGGTFALHYAELAHHAGKRENKAKPLVRHLTATLGS